MILRKHYEPEVCYPRAMKNFVLLVVALSAATTASAQGQLIRGWDGPKAKQYFEHTCNGDTWCLGTVSVVNQMYPNADGGPQALEGYTVVKHEIGTVRLVMGTIGNIELGGGSRTVVESAVALQGGLVVTGPGYVAHATSLSLVQPRAHGGYTGGVNLGRVDYITFDNGWSIRPDGDQLSICDPKGMCRHF